MCEISLFFFCQRQPLLPILLCNVTQRRFNPPHALLAQGLLHEDLHIYAVDYMKRSCCVLSLIHVWVSSGLQCVCVYEHVCVRELSRLSESIPGRYKLLTDDHY